MPEFFGTTVKLFRQGELSCGSEPGAYLMDLSMVGDAVDKLFCTSEITSLHGFIYLVYQGILLMNLGLNISPPQDAEG